MAITLEETFMGLVKRHSEDGRVEEKLWKEIAGKYAERGRYYHGLNHLESLLGKLEEVRDKIGNWDVVLFSLYYHDIIYNTLRHDNEEKSAELAVKRLTALGVGGDAVEKCKAQILATKQHLLSADGDANYFTDADLSILGQDWEVYAGYARNLRKEYSIYPDLVYKPGRKKVLGHFLAMERIFKTPWFFALYENMAKENLQKELEKLG